MKEKKKKERDRNKKGGKGSTGATGPGSKVPTANGAEISEHLGSGTRIGPAFRGKKLRIVAKRLLPLVVFGYRRIAPLPLSYISLVDS